MDAITYEAFVPRLGRAEAIAETHISQLVAVDDVVYKRKKAEAFGFVDQRSIEARRRLCELEVELNRRLAPDVYLGVAPVLDDRGAVCDYVVAMRRMRADRSLAALISAGADVHDCVRELARTVAEFHERAHRSAEITRAGSRDAVRKLWSASFDDLATFGELLDRDRLDLDRLDRLRARVDGYLLGRGPLFNERAARGRIVDGHGDLLAADVYCTPDGVRVLDCLEFDERFRFGDVLLDVAFLVMDLRWRRRPDLAERFVHLYDEHTDEHHPGSLLAHFVAYRALVRAKVAFYRARAAPTRAEADLALTEADGLLGLVDEQLAAATVRLVLVGGLPGTGKSTVAEALAAAHGWVTVSTDLVRREMAAEPLPRRWGEGDYRVEATDRVYQHVLARAATALSLGESVVVDASFHDASRRASARRLAEAAGATVAELVCAAPFDVAVRRLRQRDRSHPSDATPDVAAQMARVYAPWPEATVLDTTRSIEQTVDRAADSVLGR